MSNMLPMFYETLFGIFALFILTKVLGKTQISQLTPFDFIAAIVIGELVGNALFDKETGILDIGYVILLWGVILYTIEMITQKFQKSRFILEGKPSFLIHQGKIIYEEMRKNKIDLNELQQLLRMKDVFSVQEVEYAILETNGLLSVLRKPEYDTPTKNDLQIPPQRVDVAVSLILDGEYIEDNLAEAGVTKTWVESQMTAQQFTDVKEIFFAEWLPDKPLFILPYEKIKEKHMERKLKK